MPYLQISASECIGDSLVKINSNAFNFDTRIDLISSTWVKALSAGDRVTLTTQTLSDNTKRITITPESPYAVKFDFWANSLSTSLTSNATFNVTSVTYLSNISPGNLRTYLLTFATPLPSANYSVITSSNVFLSLSGGGPLGSQTTNSLIFYISNGDQKGSLLVFK